jgi:CheY-like chemotaxis protein
MAREEAPDLITLDITMPGMSGIEVLTTLRRDERLNGLPVVIITGVTSFDKLTDYRDVRAPEGFMQKPIDLVRLLSMIKGILDSPA